MVRLAYVWFLCFSSRPASFDQWNLRHTLTECCLIHTRLLGQICIFPLPCAQVRSLNPEAFVKLLAEELQVAGVVVGSNYRFGFKASGNAALLQELGAQYGMQVSYTRQCEALAKYSV